MISVLSESSADLKESESGSDHSVDSQNYSGDDDSSASGSKKHPHSDTESDLESIFGSRCGEFESLQAIIISAIG